MGRFTKYKINFPIVLRVIGWLLIIEAGFMTIPVVVSWYYGEASDARSIFISVLITLIAGCGFAFGIRPNSRYMSKREGMLLTAITWIFCSAFGMLPFLLTSTLETVPDAFFETMSGFTTTGATVINDVTNTPKGILMWRALTQWIGGMGIILFTLAVVPMLNYKGGITLFNAEVPGITHERMTPRISQTAKELWLMYIGISCLMFTLLMLPIGSPAYKMDWFESLCHTMSTVSTGGFSTHSDGLIHFSSYYYDTVVLVFMLLCGINFSILNTIMRGNFKKFSRFDTLKWYLLTIAFTSTIIIIRMGDEGFLDTWLERILYATFDVVSAITSTGYATADYEASGQFISLLIMVVMFFGGMAGSTAGGAKIDRAIVMLRNAKNEFYKAIHSNAVTSVRVNGDVIPQDIVYKVIAFLSIYVMIVVAGAVLLASFGIPMFDSLFTSMSAISNVGFGYGLTNGSGISLLPDFCKWLLSLEMMIGRLELFTVLVIFTQYFWIKD